MLEQMTHDDLLKLTSVHDGPCISIYIPAMPTETLQLEYEVLVKRASHLLSFDERKSLTQDLLEIIYNFNPSEHFSNMNQGLALFVNKHWHGYYLAAHDLPSKVIVSESFHLKPLIEDIQGNHSFHALVLTAEEALLLFCDGGRGTDVHTFLFHHGSHSNSIHWKHLDGSDDSENVQIPHLKSQARGRGASDNHFKKKTANKIFLRWIESKINKENGYKSLPLFVFTNDILFHNYKEITSHPAPILCTIDISKGIPQQDALIHKADAHLKSASREHKTLSTRDIQHQVRKNKMIDDLVKISRAALHGKVETLFLRDNSEVWGQLHRKSGEITFHEKQLNAKDDDILDDIACEVIRQGGEVIILDRKDMPTGSPAAAILTS